ncbi:MAG: nucleotidyltransferase [Streptosporangiaceae bacterium]|nr:nucleotidyltransferase [Streptosporangiaceae bacterium]
MNLVYGEPVHVHARADGRPLRFVWRCRLYTVREILEHWVITPEWWRDPQADPRRPDLEFWRVEAAPARDPTAAVYELRRDPATGTWILR